MLTSVRLNDIILTIPNTNHTDHTDNMSTVSTGLIYKQYGQSKHYSMMSIRVRPTYTRNSF